MPWSVVGLIGIGTFIGAVLGTGVFPVFGSVLGGAMGSFVMAFVYEYSQTMDCDDAFELAWKAAKLQFYCDYRQGCCGSGDGDTDCKQSF